MKPQNKHYRQLTQEQRHQIQAFHRKGFSQRDIAQDIGVHHRSVSRELKRNSSAEGYCAKTANQLKYNRKITYSKVKK